MMRKSCAPPFAAVVLCLASTLAVAAQRTFVGTTGTDNPSCSLPAPCRTFTAAIAATNPGGEIIVLDSAGYGTVIITKSVSIITPPGIYAGITVSSGNGVTINAPGATVVLRGLTINGQGGANGILVQQAAHVRVENCVISNMAAQGIYDQADHGEMIVLDTISRGNGDGGFVLVAANATIVLDHVRSEGNGSVGFYIAPTPAAIYARASISNGLFARNGKYGLWADSVAGAGTYVVVERSTFVDNLGTSVEATSGASDSLVAITLDHNAISGIYFAFEGLGILPGQVFSEVHGNSTSGSLRAIGSGSRMSASGNTGAGYLGCEADATLRSYGDNRLQPFALGSCTHSIVGSQ